MSNEENVINAESIVNIDMTLDQISKELEKNDTLILDIGNNYFNQTDTIYDKLVTRGYNVKKSFRNGRNQIIIVNRNH
jgi:6-phosphogluconate dehydrogenase